VLHDPQIGDFEVEVIHNASADLMRRRIQGFFNDRSRADTLLLHFSCHGLKSESGARRWPATAWPSPGSRGCGVDPTQSGLEVRVDTAVEGHLSGDISLKGAADESAIHVEAVVGPAHEPARHTEPEPRPANGSARPTQVSHDMQDTVVVEPSRIPPPPKTPPLTPARPTRKDQSAPALRALGYAGAALALAVTAVGTLIWTLQAAAVAVVERSNEGVGGNVEDNIHEHGALPPLIVCLITAALALVVSAFARHDVAARRERYTRRTAGSTHTVTSIAKGLATPALILAVLLGLAYLLGKPHW
jgi:hypothetical protein